MKVFSVLSQIVAAAKRILSQITLDDLEAVFMHCGYAGA